MDNTIVTFGIIGCGWIAENAHIVSMQKNRNIKIEAVYDTSQQRVQELCDKYNIPKGYVDLDDFWNSGIQAVVIATPNYTHVEYALSAIEHGIHVLCEKPVALHAKEIQLVLEKARKKGVLFVPGFVNRWRLDICKAKELIQEGKIGKVTHVSAGWLRKCGIPRPGTWFTNKQLSGGGVLVDLGSHVFDLVLCFLGKNTPISYEMLRSNCNPEKIKRGAASWFLSCCDASELIDVEDAIVADVKMENGVSLSVKLCWMADIEADATYFRIEGESGSIEIKTLFGFSNQRLWKDDSFVMKSKEDIHEMKFNPQNNNTKQAFIKMYEYFVTAIQGKTDAESEYDSIIADVSLIENLYENAVLNDEIVEKRLKEDI